jgi:carbon-monoxide dehydrogenase large subunit
MADVDGTWNCTMTSPMGSGSVTLTLRTEGSALSGTLVSDQGTMEFDGGTVDGNDLAWTVSVTQPMAIQIETTATIDGDTLTGQSKLGSFGSAQLSGTRA